MTSTTGVVIGTPWLVSCGPTLLLIDEASGRVEARRRHLRVTGRRPVFYIDEALILSTFGRWLRK